MGEKALELQAIYARRFAERSAYRRALWKRLNECFFQPLIGEAKTILDLGAGWGEFINHIHARRKYALDMNPDAAQHMAEDVKFLAGDCTQPWPVPDAELDVVFTSNFLEHLPDRCAINQTLRHAFRCLKPGGRLICVGPNIKYIGGAYWDFYDHIIPLTHLSLAEALRLANFEIERVFPRFLPFTMSAGRPPPLFFVPFYLRLPLLWPVFGRQFLVVARKPEKSV